ncbi:hypothetical protein H7X68_03945 [Candidatus Saccharibacteria bacterium]|nr:hypothetical protein [Candidatus Saccharibacteria bacterium]
MKVKYIIIAQVILLAGAVVLGLILKGDLADGPRVLHRAIGGLAGGVSLISAIVMLRHGIGMTQKTLSWVAVAFSFLAGFAGSSLRTVGSYDMMFGLMSISGFIALAAAIALLVLVIKRDSVANTTK